METVAASRGDKARAHGIANTRGLRYLADVHFASRGGHVLARPLSSSARAPNDKRAATAGYPGVSAYICPVLPNVCGRHQGRAQPRVSDLRTSTTVLASWRHHTQPRQARTRKSPWMLRDSRKTRPRDAAYKGTRGSFSRKHVLLGAAGDQTADLRSIRGNKKLFESFLRGLVIPLTLSGPRPRTSVPSQRSN